MLAGHFVERPAGTCLAAQQQPAEHAAGGHHRADEEDQLAQQVRVAIAPLAGLLAFGLHDLAADVVQHDLHLGEIGLLGADQRLELLQLLQYSGSLHEGGLRRRQQYAQATL